MKKIYLKLLLSFLIFSFSYTVFGDDIQEDKVTDRKISEIKEEFENTKNNILKNLKNGQITLEEAKNEILEQKEILSERIEEVLENKKLNNIKNTIKRYLQEKLSSLDDLSKEEQIEKYKRISKFLDKLLEDGNKEKYQIYKIIKEIIQEKIESLES